MKPILNQIDEWMEKRVGYERLARGVPEKCDYYLSRADYCQQRINDLLDLLRDYYEKQR